MFKCTKLYGERLFYKLPKRYQNVIQEKTFKNAGKEFLLENNYYCINDYLIDSTNSEHIINVPTQTVYLYNG